MQETLACDVWNILRHRTVEIVYKLCVNRLALYLWNLRMTFKSNYERSLVLLSSAVHTYTAVIGKGEKLGEKQ